MTDGGGRPDAASIARIPEVPSVVPSPGLRPQPHREEDRDPAPPLSRQPTAGREMLLQEVWGYNSGVTTHTLETHIYRLRQKVERDDGSPAILVTESGGYKLVP